MSIIENSIHQLAASEPLTEVQSQQLFTAIMQGEASEVQIAAVLLALRVRGESIAEIQGAVSAMREQMTRVALTDSCAIDIVGTGGDGANLFNVSTAAAFVASACGAIVAKHGGRGVSSSSGAANVIQALGINIELTADQVQCCISRVGIGFMFAPMFHSAMRHVAPVRAALKTRTIFNLLGPMCNPASVKRYLLGVFDQKWLMPVAKVLQQLGVERAMIVHSEDGLDEISIAAPTQIVEIKDLECVAYQIDPKQLGLRDHSLQELTVSSIAESKKMILDGFSGDNQGARSMIAINAGAALQVAGIAKDLEGGYQMAEEAMSSGLALEKIKLLQQTAASYE